ncbi:sensor histidine kinase [Nesterenkonia salmonea]|uniref:histidine kinase n=1 Tax=Nesterenkonia salmonea TaxID=1804987 RepID=A0A5R9B9V8_9MICC|nr:histidine kinase [Nesterenkonia salmonea]TLP96194.1 sensor histidine kinase [Nesterenkonia salmonea]
MPDRPLAAPPVHVRVVRFFERRLWLGDTLFKVVPLLLLSALFWMGSSGGSTSGYTTGMLGTSVLLPAMVVLEFLAIAPLALSRIRPGLASGIIAFAALCQMLAMYGPGYSAISVPLAVYACAKYGNRSVSLTYLVTGLIGAVLLGLLMVASASGLTGEPAGGDWGVALTLAVLITGFAAAVVLSAWLFGDLAGRRRREREAIEEKNLLLQRERDQEARLAADAERLRIAREIHDVVSHSMGVMIAQADGGRYVIDQDPVRAGEAFETIGDTGREALTELRRMLGVLREEGALKKRPAPGVSDIPRLVDDVRSSGLEVELNIAEQTLPPLSEGVELALYRIAQEALTNTLKHGGPHAKAFIWLGTDYRAGELTLEISDTGRGATAKNDGAGSGLMGMVERARLYGGTLTAKPKGEESLEAGFAVEARFPLERVRPQGRGR